MRNKRNCRQLQNLFRLLQCVEENIKHFNRKKTKKQENEDL